MAIWSLRLRPVCSLAPTSPAISVTRRSIDGVDVLVVGDEDERARDQLALHLVEGGQQLDHLVVVEQAAAARGPAHGRGTRPGRRGPAPGRSAGSTSTSMTTSAVSRPEASVPQGHRERTARPTPPSLLDGRPGGDAQPPQPDEALGVLVAEGVGGVVGGQAVVVEAHRAAPAHHPAPAGVEGQADLAGDVPLRLDDEGVERLLERREPQPVVDQLRPAGLEPGLLVVEVALEGEVLEIGVGHEQGEGRRAFVGLPALDARPAGSPPCRGDRTRRSRRSG